MKYGNNLTTNILVESLQVLQHSQKPLKNNINLTEVVSLKSEKSF